MDNIGYAIFKKASALTIDSNGMFEDLQLSGGLNSLLQLIQSGKQLLCFKRVASKKSNPNIKDAYLVILLENSSHSRSNYVLGSAICFKGYQVNESKIIDGVHYLLSQLKRNFKGGYDINGKDLGVLLPSTNKDFKIFKSQKLVLFAQNPSFIGNATISLENNENKEFLHHFQNNKNLGDIELLLLSKYKVQGYFDGNRINPISIKSLINPKKSPNIAIAKSADPVQEPRTSNLDSNKLMKEKEKIRKSRNLFKILTAVFFVLFAFFAILSVTKNTTSSDSIYEIGDDLFISFSSYNVNIRSTPTSDYGDSNLKTTLADGDRVHLLGFDKETLWAKIRYDEDQTGYVSNRLISKQIYTNRVRPIYKEAIIDSGFISAPLYTSPGEIEEDFPTIKLYLKEGDKILVKNQDLRLNSYSVSVEKDNEVFHGFMEKKYFHFE
jgi:hypothetical protein